MKFVRFDNIPVNDITVGERLRQVDMDWAATLAGMIRASGLQGPVEVIDNFPGCPTKYHLAAGAHRLAAVDLILGWPKIDARVVTPETDNPELELRLHEITENVGRRELSAIDRAAHLAELERVYRELYPVRRGGDRKSQAAIEQRENQKGNHCTFDLPAEVAAKCGLGVRTVKAALALHHRLSPEVRQALALSPLADNQAELVRLSRLSSERQEAVLKLMLAPEPKARKVQDAVHTLDDWIDPQSPEEKAFAKLVRAWHSAPRKAQRQFVDYLRAHKQLGTRQERGPAQ